MTPPELQKSDNQLESQVNSNLEKAQRNQKVHFDKKSASKTVFEVGDFVLLKNSRQRKGQ